SSLLTVTDKTPTRTLLDCFKRWDCLFRPLVDLPGGISLYQAVRSHHLDCSYAQNCQVPPVSGPAGSRLHCYSALECSAARLRSRSRWISLGCHHDDSDPSFPDCRYSTDSAVWQPGVSRSAGADSCLAPHGLSRRCSLAVEQALIHWFRKSHSALLGSRVALAALVRSPEGHGAGLLAASGSSPRWTLSFLQ